MEIVDSQVYADNCYFGSEATRRGIADVRGGAEIVSLVIYICQVQEQNIVVSIWSHEILYEESRDK